MSMKKIRQIIADTPIGAVYHLLRYAIEWICPSKLSSMCDKAYKEYLQKVGEKAKPAFQQFKIICPEDFICFIDSYKKMNIRKIKEMAALPGDGGLILICHVRDDLQKVIKQVEHHKNMGVKHFVYIDNMSIDGTFEWLLEQDDIAVWRVDEKFNWPAAASWHRQIIEYYGYNRWYLNLDSDEMFAYPKMETIKLPKYIAVLERKNISVVSAFMLDMYSKDAVFAGDDTDFVSSLKYFDKKYRVINRIVTQLIKGGPRERLFGRFEILHKHPLIFAKQDLLWTNHVVYPYRYNLNSSIVGVLLHYKFINSDREKYDRIISDGNYANGSKFYKNYKANIEKNPNLSFYYSDSVELKSSLDLLKINIIDKGFFNDADFN